MGTRVFSFLFCDVGQVVVIHKVYLVNFGDIKIPKQKIAKQFGISYCKAIVVFCQNFD
jgi:hypothetical protein